MSAAFENGQIWLVALIVLSSLLAVIYVWRVVEVAYFQEPDETMTKKREAPLLMLVPTWILIIASYFFGVNATMTGQYSPPGGFRPYGIGGLT